MDDLAQWLFDPAGLTPHGFCLLWEPGLIWTHAISDTVIGLAYFSIPLALAIFARRRKDLVFRPVFWLFAAFILLCGTTHWLALLTLWVPAYGIEGLVKAATAVVSIGTAIALWHLLPHALALPSPAQLQEVGAALRESEARHRISFERSPVPLHTLDESGIITGVSDSWITLFGYSRDEVVGRHLTAFLQPGSPGWVEAELRRLRSDGEIRDLERHFLGKDGRLIRGLASARLERRDGATWIVCVVVDITARRLAEEALRVSEDRLHQAQKMEAVGQLTGGIAHDFNNMLQSIGGGLDLMERRIAQGRPDEAARYVRAARQSVTRAAGLTHRMLAFARRQTLQPVPVDPDTLVRGMEELIRQTVGTSIQMQLHLHDGKWATKCDPNQLDSALMNLVINARDAMPHGGILTIETADRVVGAADALGQEEVEPGAYVEIAVADTGTGMSPDVLARAFEPFYTTKPLGQGTGLGLSQVYGFVKQSGGFVKLESAGTEAGGTTVRLYLPRHESIPGTASKQAVPERHGPVGATEPLEPGKSVLVVEDQTDVRAMIAARLRDLGCSVVEAEDGPAGLRIVRSTVWLDLLVTDVGLPGLSGRQLADAARESLPGLPVMLITGYAGADGQEFELAPGMEVLRKPFPLNEFAAKARAMLNLKRPVVSSGEGMSPT